MYILGDRILKALGLVGFEVVKLKEMDVLKGDEEFWGDFVVDLNLTVVMVRKL